MITIFPESRENAKKFPLYSQTFFILNTTGNPVKLISSHSSRLPEAMMGLSAPSAVATVLRPVEKIRE